MKIHIIPRQKKKKVFQFLGKTENKPKRYLSYMWKTNGHSIAFLFSIQNPTQPKSAFFHFNSWQFLLLVQDIHESSSVCIYIKSKGQIKTKVLRTHYFAFQGKNMWKMSISIRSSHPVTPILHWKYHICIYQSVEQEAVKCIVQIQKTVPWLSRIVLFFFVLLSNCPLFPFCCFLH